MQIVIKITIFETLSLLLSSSNIDFRTINTNPKTQSKNQVGSIFYIVINLNSRFSYHRNMDHQP